MCKRELALVEADVVHSMKRSFAVLRVWRVCLGACGGVALRIARLYVMWHRVAVGARCHPQWLTGRSVVGSHHSRVDVCRQFGVEVARAYSVRGGAVC